MMQEKKSLLAFSTAECTLLLYAREVTNIHHPPEALSHLLHTEPIMGSGLRFDVEGLNELNHVDKKSQLNFISDNSLRMEFFTEPPQELP